MGWQFWLTTGVTTAISIISIIFASIAFHKTRAKLKILVDYIWYNERLPGYEIRLFVINRSSEPISIYKTELISESGICTGNNSVIEYKHFPDDAYFSAINIAPFGSIKDIFKFSCQKTTTSDMTIKLYTPNKVFAFDLMPRFNEYDN